MRNGAAGLASSGTSTLSARGWLATSQPANVQAAADVYVNSLTASQVLVRGSNLNTSSPTYYALTVQRGLYAQLVRVVNGVSTTLASLSSASGLTSRSVRVRATSGFLSRSTRCPSFASALTT